MTGLLLFLLLLAALALGLVAHHRHIRRQGPPRLDAEVQRELRTLGL